MLNKIIQGDCLESIKMLEDNSVDAVVCDPPYGLSFMGKKWDYDVPSVEIWKECLRVLKPGGYLLAFAGTRTQHRMAVRIEDAGFEIRDIIAWIYGSGFPKSLNISDAIAKREGAKREGAGTNGNTFPLEHEYREYTKTENSEKWEGWGTALKPALEPITVARKPLSEKTVAENVLKWGTGGINIDGSRVGTEGILINGGGGGEGTGWGKKEEINEERIGRFPANLIHDGSDEAVDLFPNESQRFFYCAKASKSERNKGCEWLPVRQAGGLQGRADGSLGREPVTARNFHPTVKPIALMEYLVKLVSREGAIILDPFTGSGSTGIACKNLNRQFIGCELDPEYCKIASARTGFDIEISQEEQDEIQENTDTLEEKLEALGVPGICDCGGKIVKLKTGNVCQDCLKDI